MAIGHIAQDCQFETISEVYRAQCFFLYHITFVEMSVANTALPTSLSACGHGAAPGVHQEAHQKLRPHGIPAVASVATLSHLPSLAPLTAVRLSRHLSHL